MDNRLILERVKASKVVAVVRTNSEDQALKAVDACIRGGFRIVELTYSIPNSATVLKHLVNKYSQSNAEVVFGMGTVTSVKQVTESIESGAQFIVSPNLNLEIADYCQKSNIWYIPGAMTVNELVDGTKLSILKTVKLFPASTFKPSYLAGVLAPFPKLLVMATGGVDEHNLKDWLQAGCFAVGIGGNLFAGVKTDDFVAIEMTARKYVALAKEIA